MVALIVTACVAALLTVGFLFVRVTQKPIYGLLAKIFPSVGFVVMGVTALSLRSSIVPFGAPIFVLGMVLGLIGDIVLDAKRAHPEFNGIYLTAGMTSFITGHGVYIAATCLVAIYFFNLSILFPAAICAIIGIVAGPLTVFISEKGLKANFGKHRIISGAYGGLLIFFTAFTLWLTVLNIGFLLLFLGVLLFLLSDLVLSQMYFCEGKAEDKVLVIVNHTLYYAAQILIACFVFKICL